MDSFLFGPPFLTGLCFALLLPLVGVYLRLRGEWLAALAYAHVAAAGALLALAVDGPLALGGAVASLLAALLKRPVLLRLGGAQGRRGVRAGEAGSGAAYAFLLIGGWAASVLLTANLPMAERLGHALFDGQLYFTGLPHLIGAGLCWLLGGLALRWLGPQLLLARLYPDLLSASSARRWPVTLGFDALVAMVLALATMSLGVMGSFALLFIPPWLAFRVAPSWRHGLLVAVAGGALAYCVAFALALLSDQPFGPVLAGVCLLLAMLGSVFPTSKA